MDSNPNPLHLHCVRYIELLSLAVEQTTSSGIKR
jgi:hypothetical protein